MVWGAWNDDPSLVPLDDIPSDMALDVRSRANDGNMITVASYILTAAMWLLILPFWPLWLLFSELCDWMDRRGQRRYRRQS